MPLVRVAVRLESRGAGDRRRGFAPRDSAVVHRDGGAGQAREKCDAEADRAGADHQHVVAVRDGAATYGVGADRQEFDGGALIGREAVCVNEIARRQGQKLSHPAILVNAEHGNTDATIGLAGAAGDTAAAGKVGIDDTNLAGCETRTCRGLDHLDSKLVAHDPRILKIRVLALEDVIVGAAYADPPRPHQRVARLPLRDGSSINLQLARRKANQGIHVLHVTTCAVRTAKKECRGPTRCPSPAHIT